MAQLNQEAHKIQLRSEEIQEILGTPPSWITQWGTLIVLLTLFLLLGLSFLIKSPDKVQGEFILKAENAPIKIKATFDGQVSDLLVRENQKVKQGTPLFVIQSNTRYSDVLKLEKILKPLAKMDAEMLLTTPLPQDLQLGSLSNQYTELLASYNKLRTEKSKMFENFKINSIQNKKRQYSQKIKEYEKQIQIYNDKRQNAQKILETLKENYGTDKSITLKMLKDAKADISNYLSKIIALKEKQDAIKNSIKNLSNQSTEIRVEKNDKDKVTLDEVRYNANKLLSDIQVWKGNFLVKSPIEGKVLFYPNLKVKQEYFQTNDNILAIKPNNSKQKKVNTPTIGQVLVDKADYDKIEIDQPIFISLSSHPSMKYGKIRGKVSGKTELLDGDKYIIETKIPKPLVTTTGVTINIQNEVEGKAEIITEEKSFFYRFFHEIL